MPPFAGLLAFEAVLRHGSMTLAGDELGLTQSAVSHRIRALEDFFGVALLERLNPGLRVTEAGGRLAQELGPLLGTLAGMHRRIVGRTGLRAFRLGLSTPLLAWWLSPRLPALCGGFPDLSIEVVTWDKAAEAARVDVDLALLWLPYANGVEGACALPFPIESVFPVVAPGLLSTLCPGQDWRALPLLAKGRRGDETGREWSWATWLQGDPGHEAVRFRDIGSSLQAAVDGNGVALARSLLAADALRQRRLTRLTGSDEIQACSKRQIARWRDTQDSTAERMATWLVLSAGQSVPVSNPLPVAIA
ncbi:LysR family transcriptional regulator, glycine cleavage system transcriptional activator [Methylobacterium phyllostachyos]|uniref:LysR family transcriptional regulator, glycine cleavage system transcriptional activator n=1 Tax=Methylobacterium phyllostachyos TaxID=582672 RepID=A0A1H0CDU4_9HYPH|nr:LysR family transcriptional regulator [Methylobacterium phyllostachyos]SDN56078.1 LysR family transcriptional regulator, glycine cleavage system transcriptional activator [Methylobacterium phyllostachyos]